MAYCALFSLLASLVLSNNQPSHGALHTTTNETTQEAIIVGPIPTSLSVPVSAPPTYTAALSGLTDGRWFGDDVTCDDADNASQLSDDDAANAAALYPPPAVLSQAVPLFVAKPSIRYSNIPVCLLDTSRPIDRVAAVISSNEGKPTTIDWNDNGRGVSVGIFQANQRVGELPDLLHKLGTVPGGQEAIADAFGPTVAQQVQQNPEVVRRFHFSPKNALGKGLQKLVQSQLFQKLQVCMLRNKVARAAELAADYGITSTAGVAVCADLANQWGTNGAQRFLHAADTMRSEGGKIKAVVHAVCKLSRYGSRYQGDLEKVAANNLSFNQPFPFDSNTVEAEINDQSNEIQVSGLSTAGAVAEAN